MTKFILMKPAAMPGNEQDRLRALVEYQLLDTLPEDVYDDITKIATEVCGTPISLLTIVDEKRQWFKSKQGFEVDETPRKLSFCAHAILDPSEIMIVPDARYDERFFDNPLTNGEPPVVFYAGVPVVDPNGFALGTLCVIDSRPRELPGHKLEALKALSKLVSTHFELRKVKMDLEKSHQIISKVEGSLEKLCTVTGNLMSGKPREDQLNSLKLLEATSRTAIDILRTV